jgi:hypothetical protein
MKKILSLSVLFAVLALTVGCSDSKTTGGTPAKAGGVTTTMPGPAGGTGTGTH